MAGDGESVDIGVRDGTRSSLSVEDHREQGSPLSCAEATGHTPGSNNPHTPGMQLSGSPDMRS